MRRFYCDVIGCTVERELDPAVGLVQLRAGTALIDLVPVGGELGRRFEGPPDHGRPNLDHLCLRIEPFDAERIVAELEAAGCRPQPPARRYGAEGFGPSIYVDDPEGNTVELKGPPEP